MKSIPCLTALPRVTVPCEICVPFCVKKWALIFQNERERKMKTKCSVCGKRFMPYKETVYLASETPTLGTLLTKAPTAYDAIDCPRCGCQKLLKIRIPKIAERENENETESET